MLAIALMHYPTVNKEGRVVATSVTNFDIHDIARASRTYGVDRYYIVTPIELQQQFTRRILMHWVQGPGAEYNPSRHDALTGVEVAADLTEVGEAIARDFGASPFWVATSAKAYPHQLTCKQLRERLAGPQPVCLIFGTGSGLHPHIFELADATLEPLQGPTPYRHLSVRSAVSIYLDRLLGIRTDC